MHEAKEEALDELGDILGQLVDTTQGLRYSIHMLYENLQGMDDPDITRTRSILYMFCQTLTSVEDKLDRADDLVEHAKAARLDVPKEAEE